MQMLFWSDAPLMAYMYFFSGKNEHRYALTPEKKQMMQH